VGMKTQINKPMLAKVQRMYASSITEAVKIHDAIAMYLHLIDIEKATLKDDEQ
jgi:hypothetical protein